MDTLHLSPLTLTALALTAPDISLAANASRRAEPQVFDLATDLADEFLADDADSPLTT